ncbi:MAG: hypothetical protein ACRENJ_05630 [Candidatus Eiseniibacteriota bacterium]
MNRNRIKLLVTLVLFILAATGAGMLSQADARGHSGPGASSHLNATRPGADLAAGEPDAGSGVAPPPPPTMKQLCASADRGRGGLVEWARWTGRIWATLYLKAAR